MKRCGAVEADQRASSQESLGQRIFCCLASRVFSCYAPGKPFLEKKPLLGGPIPKIGHGDLVGSGVCITGVSVTFNSFVILTFVNFLGLFKPMAGLKNLVLLLATFLLLCLLCVNAMFLLSLRK